MKKFYLIILLFTNIVAFGQSFTVAWNFGTNIAAADLSPTTTSSIIDAGSVSVGGGVTATSYSGTGSSSGGGAYGGTSWNLGGGYIEFSITPKFNATDKRTLNLIGATVSFSMRATSTGPRTWTLRSSIDNYSSSLGSGNLISTTAFEIGKSVTLPSTNSYKNITSTVTFRIYGTSASASAGTGRFDDISISGLTPQPVTLEYFKANTYGKSVNLNWETSTETNNKSFAIERSADLKEFGTLTEIEGKGNATETNIYNYTDENPILGTSYYRLRQVDYDGKQSYSKIVSVNIEENEPGLLVYPNPTNAKQIFLKMVNIDAQNLKLVSLTGANIPFSLEKQKDGISIQPSSELKGGTYFLQGVSESGKKIINKIIIE